MRHPSSSLVEFPCGIPIQTGPFGKAVRRNEAERGMWIHHDWDLLFIEHGHTAWRFRSGEAFDVPENHFLLLPPSTPVWAQPGNVYLSLWFCHFSFHPIPHTVFPSVRRDCMEYGRAVLIPYVFSRSEAPGVWRAYRDLLAIDFNAEGPPLRMAGALTRLISELGAFALRLNLPGQAAIPEAVDAGRDPRLVEMSQRISNNPAFPWKVSELAKSVNLSAGHLERLCRQSLGKSLKRHIVESRLHYALRLLNDPAGRSTISMKELSAACGFSSQHFFSRQFRKFFAISPSKYREQLGKNML